MTTPLAVAILAGGASRRFGTDKAAVVIDGEPLLDRTLGIASALTPRVAVIGGDHADLSAPVLPDREPGAGPLQAAVVAFEHFQGADLLLIPCDLPRLTVDHLRLLGAPLTADTSKPLLARLSENDGQPSAIPGFYSAASVETFRAHMEAGRRALHPMLQELPHEVLTEDDLRRHGLDPLGLRDFDTPDELRRLSAP